MDDADRLQPEPDQGRDRWPGAGIPAITLSATRLGAYDFFIEITIDTNKIVWEWNPWDTPVQSKNPAWPNYVDDVKNAPGRFDIYWMTDNQQPAISGNRGTRERLGHVNSIDYNDETGHVVINPKHWSDFIVVDHDSTFVSTTNWAANKAAAAGPDGDLIYRWGNPSSYNSGTAPGWMTEGDSQMYGSHDIQFIRPYLWSGPTLATDKWPDPRHYTKSGVSLPGAGNFLIFDNGCYNPNGMKSRVLEINPPHRRLGERGGRRWASTSGRSLRVTRTQRNIEVSPEQTDGLELRVPDAAQLLQQPYLGRPASAQRQHLIDAGNQGHFFEVTPAGRVVWEYLYPGIPGSTGMGGGFTRSIQTAWATPTMPNATGPIATGRITRVLQAKT